MFGLGGIWLELVKDVAFGPPGLNAEQAEGMIDRTRAGKLLFGYRGAPPYDREAVVSALVSLGKLAADYGPFIEAIDINPFVALPKGQGAVALDGLVVARPVHKG